MAKRIKKPTLKAYTIRYSEDEDAEYCTICEQNSDDAKAFTQTVANKTGCSMQLFEVIEGSNFHVSEINPSYGE
jgi:hypothetical protein